MSPRPRCVIFLETCFQLRLGLSACPISHQRGEVLSYDLCSSNETRRLIGRHKMHDKLQAMSSEAPETCAPCCPMTRLLGDLEQIPNTEGPYQSTSNIHVCGTHGFFGPSKPLLHMSHAWHLILIEAPDTCAWEIVQPVPVPA